MTRLRAIDVQVFRVPLERPVQTSFGRMRDRPAVVVRLEDDGGAFGWGEVFCNWPAAGAEHRARLILEDIADLVFAQAWDGPADMFHALTEQTHIKVLQTAEPGPFAQAIAGLDLAFWDLHARKAGQPLAHCLNAAAAQEIQVYASGIQIDDAPAFIATARDAGFRAFKVKIGFDIDADAEKLRAVFMALKPGERLMADANQAWSLGEATGFLERTRDVDLGWLEEPMRVDAPEQDWRRLAEASHVPLAGGENLLGMDIFSAAITAGALGVIQPDAAKWGGITGCLEIARRAEAAGRLYCPHFLGAGVGLLASGHLLAAAGGRGMLEVDVNPNPLRSDMLPGWPAVADGMATLIPGPGIGCEPVLDTLQEHRTYAGHRERDWG